MLYYKIIPYCNMNLVLTLNLQEKNAAVLLEESADNRERQLWTPIEVISKGNDKGFALVSKHKNEKGEALVLAAQGDREALKSISSSAILTETRAAWKFCSIDSELGGLQLQANTNMNLNVFGDGPYKSGNQVGIHDWKDKSPNELWQFSLVGDF